MPRNHEPDPRFVQSLEGQIGRELRRQHRTGGGPGTGVRVMKVAGLMLGSVALGAAAMGASQQLGEAWRKELLETRLEVQLQLAQQRVQVQLDAVGLTRQQVELGVRGDQDLAVLEYQIAQAEADARITELELEEVRRSGREPVGELSSPLVDGRDFVSEKIQIRMQVARHHMDIVEAALTRTQERVDVGLISDREMAEERLLSGEAELTIETLTRKLELRRAYLDSEVSAVEAELRLLEAEAQSRVVLLEARLLHFQREAQRFQAAIDAGTIHPMAVATMQTQVAEIDAQLNLAQAELRIVRAELERRESQR
jgi:outer membrane protein TolC